MYATSSNRQKMAVVTKTQNGMERNGLFHPALLRIVHPGAIQYFSLNPNNFDLGILTLNRTFLLITPKITECSAPFVPFRSGF